MNKFIWDEDHSKEIEDTEPIKKDEETPSKEEHKENDIRDRSLLFFNTIKDKVLNFLKSIDFSFFKKINRKIFLIITIIILLIILIFLPIFKINEVKVVNSNILNADDIVQYVDFSNSASTFKIIKEKIAMNSYNSYIKDATLNYSFSNKQIIIDVEEFRPIYHNSTTDFYFNEKNELAETASPFPTPYFYDNIQGEDLIYQICEQLGKLPYDIFLQIKSISLDNEEREILKIQMFDGNDVYIYPEQIYQKMRYYNQMSFILEKNDKEPGNIYLYIGDYYEPKN